MFSILFTSFLLLWYFQFYWKRRHLYEHSRKVPGPKGWPIVGNIFDFVGSADVIYNNIMKYFDSYPQVGKIWYGNTLIYGISKPEYIQVVLSSTKALSKMQLYKKVGLPLLGNGLLTASTPTWRYHRKLAAPAFHQRVLDGLVDVFVKHSSILGQLLEEHVGENDFDIHNLMTRCTFDLSCETILGVRSGDSDAVRWLFRLLEILLLRIHVIWYKFDFVFKWTHLYQEEKQVAQNFDIFVTKIIKDKLANKKTGGTTYRNQSLLDSLIDENKLTLDEIRDETKTFLVAATDTTAVTACFAFTMLAMHPHIEDLVYKEAMDVLGPERTVLPDDLPHLQYTERVVKETLRLFPPAAFLLREIDEDLPLEDNIVLPKGSSVFLAIIRLHRNAEIWPNPLNFDPDRFLPEEVKKRHTLSFLPFSSGPKHCIGQRQGLMSLKIMLATVVRKFRFETKYEKVEDIKLETHLVLRPQDGFKISVELRE